MPENTNLDALSDSEYEQLEAQYEKRNEQLQYVIDIVAGYTTDELSEHGMKTQIAEEHGVEQHRIYYVLNHWNDLVKLRRHGNRDPLDPEAVKAAYDDETMKAMASQGQPVADGAGDIMVNVELSLDEVFRAIKLLPGDLGLKVYSQALSADIPRSDVRALLERDN